LYNLDKLNGKGCKVLIRKEEIDDVVKEVNKNVEWLVNQINLPAL
jgi:hypothetical protein